MGGDAHNKMLPTYFIKVIEGHGNHSAVGKGREAEVGFPLWGEQAFLERACLRTLRGAFDHFC